MIASLLFFVKLFRRGLTCFGVNFREADFFNFRFLFLEEGFGTKISRVYYRLIWLWCMENLVCRYYILRKESFWIEIGERIIIRLRRLLFEFTIIYFIPNFIAVFFFIVLVELVRLVSLVTCRHSSVLPRLYLVFGN